MGDGCKVFTISPGRPFLEAIATQLLAETVGDPLALSRYLVLLPTRRACRAAAQAFLRAGAGKSLVLPTFRPLGEIDEDQIILDETTGFEDLRIPPTVSAVHRQLLLTRLILSWPREGRKITLDQAGRLANDLCRLLDQVQTARLTFDGFATLVPAEYAAHWQGTLEFLKILIKHWPVILAEFDALDPAEHRNQSLAAQRTAWIRNPPNNPIIVAGSTGSIPATVDLLATVVTLPEGRVILPGLMRHADEREWLAIMREHTHPQHGLATLLLKLDIKPDEVEEWPGAATAAPVDRVQLANEILRAAETSDAWRALSKLPEQSLKNLERIDCADEGEEASVIALKMRHTLMVPGKTAALITPDRRLGRRVAAELRRWDIEIDDSGGQSIGDTVQGTYLRLVAMAAAQQFSPVSLLAMLKHPLASGGMALGSFRALVRSFELLVMRGPRPGVGIETLFTVLKKRKEENEIDTSLASDLGELIKFLELCIKPLAELMTRTLIPMEELVQQHLTAAELLAGSNDSTGAINLWSGDAGEVLSNFFSELSHSSEVLPKINGYSYLPLLESLMAKQVIRPKVGRHPRLNIWGLLEARLQHADLIILGGLNEATWPSSATIDPWLSRPMRAAFGLPLPERRIGLAAHDFVQAFCAGEVVLTRSRKVDGTPTVPSRWLVRLDTILNGVGLRPDVLAAPQWQSWSNAINEPKKPIHAIQAGPKPPIFSRPRQLSVTSIETWMRDPYTIYARHILNLKPLDPLEVNLGASARGIFIHEALEMYLKEVGGKLPQDAREKLLEHGKRAFGPAIGKPGIRAFWWPRFERITEWFLQNESEVRAEISRSFVEVRGQMKFEAPGGEFTLTAMADRIDQSVDGIYSVIDYKTGAVPSNNEVERGRAPQLPLQAAIIAEGGFEGLEDEVKVVKLSYWRLTGDDPAGEIRSIDGDVIKMASQALEQLKCLVTEFDNESTPYLTLPNPDRTIRHNDYLHLSRALEWTTSGSGDGS